MTGNNQDGHHPVPGLNGHRLVHDDLPAAEAPLSAEASAGAVLDPEFIADLANELFADGRPTAPILGAAAAADRNRAAPPVEGVPAHLPLPAAGALPGVRFDGIGLQDVHFFFEDADNLAMPLPAGLANHPATLDLNAGETFYFLAQRAPAPPLPAVPAPPAAARVPEPFPVEAIRRDFPMLQQKVHGKPLIWMDNAATAQKPRPVIEAVTQFYERHNSNTRAQHSLAVRVTNLYADARDKVRGFLGAADADEIVFTHGATEAINLVAQAYGRKHIRKGDEIVLTTLEHHANIVPWQQLVQENEAVLRIIPVNDRGEVLLEEYERLLGPRTRMVAITHVANAVGTILPVRQMTQLAHRHGARVLIDGAQAAPHLAVDVQALGCDFYVFAGHKLYGPTGIGVLYGKREMLEAMPPWQGGGNMIDEVTFEHTTYKPAPAKFEAGTGILAGAIGLSAAIDYLDQLGMENLGRYEDELLAHATAALGEIAGLRLIGTAAERVAVLSFVLEGVRTEDVGRLLDNEGIAVRVGRHCAQPTMRRFGVTSTVRPSLAFYNTHAEIDTLMKVVARARATLA